MQPLGGSCGHTGGICIPNPSTLRFDDISALNRLYPITAQNLAGFPGKVLTGANTVSIRGTVSFRTGSPGMQGVNVVARPLDANGNPLYQYAVTSVSGAFYSGNHGNPITGTIDVNGTPYSQWGSTDSTRLQGSFDLSDIPAAPRRHLRQLPAHLRAHQSALHILEDSVTAPYTVGQVTPSGTLSAITLDQPLRRKPANPHCHWRSRFCGRRLSGRYLGAQGLPRPMPSGGEWVGLSQPGRSKRLVQLPGSRQPHFHHRHPGHRRNRHALRQQSHARPRHLGRL